MYKRQKEASKDKGGMCSCATPLSEDELNDFVRPWNPHFFLGLAQGPKRKTFSKCGVEWKSDAEAPVVDLGTTCSYEKFKTDGQCVIEAK